MKYTFLALFALLLFSNASAQKYFSKTAHIRFFSHTSIEDIKADNYKSELVINKSTGAVQASALIKMFEFEKALMQEHFNENYMESNQFPKATFSGKGDFSQVNFGADGNYSIPVAGSLTLHGVTKNVNIKVNVKIQGGKITGDTKFVINPKDHGIKIEDAYAGKISDKIDVSVKATLAVLNK
ncbi:MAG: YceI family protein [Bacteroidota bacterium]|jgi:polyisoprenoid-binding protein YceI